MADQEDKHGGETPESPSKKDTGTGLESEDKRQDHRTEDPMFTSSEKNAIEESDSNDRSDGDDEWKKKKLEDLKRKAFYSVLRAFTAETLTIGNKRTQLIEKLMKEFNISQETRISFEDHIQKNHVARQQRVDSEVKEVEARPLNISDRDDETRYDETDKLLELTKEEALTFLLEAYTDVSSTMEMNKVIQELTDHWSETKPPIPRVSNNQVRMRKKVDKFIDIDHRAFWCVCGQKFERQSNLTTHMRSCKDVALERVFQVVSKKQRSVFNILSAPSASQSIRTQRKLRSAYVFTEKSLHGSSRAASKSESKKRRAIDSVLLAFKGESSEERRVFIQKLKRSWRISSSHGMTLKRREDAEIKQAEIKQARFEIDLSNQLREDIMSMVGPAMAILKLNRVSLPPHVVVEEEEGEEEA